jgi:L,D-transpeptidase ErfK/SrfK
MFLRIIFTSTLLLLLSAPEALALTFQLPPSGSSVVGHVQHVQAQENDNLSRLGRRYDIGYYELVEANPDLDPEHIEPGTEIVIPSRFILPAVPRTGVVINLAELRLYYYPPHSHTVITLPVGIGSEGWNTPVGLSKISAKIKDPTWVVPKSIHDDRAKDGVELPKSISAGPENPMGSYALHLAIPGQAIRIHGSKQADLEGIGRRSSHGCIRLFPEDIETLFSSVSKGTAVNIINQSVKVGWLRKKLYLESHQPLEEQDAQSLTPIVKLITAATQHRLAKVDWSEAREVADAETGIPRVIGIARSGKYPKQVAAAIP